MSVWVNQSHSVASAGLKWSWRSAVRNRNQERKGREKMVEEFLPLLDRVSGTLCLSHYVTETSHLYSSRDFWRHFGLCRAAAHSGCCFFAPCTNILTYLLTYLGEWAKTRKDRRGHTPIQQQFHQSCTGRLQSTDSVSRCYWYFC